MTEEYYVELVRDDPGGGVFNEEGEWEHQKIMTWLCPGCGRFVDWEFGCDDEMGHLCDDCWFEEVNPHQVERSENDHQREGVPG
jgi:hypothetical protein